MVAAVSGILAVLTTYLVSSALFDFDMLFSSRWSERNNVNLAKATPLLAALTMAILYPALTISRYGIRAMLFVPFSTLAIYFFWKGVNYTQSQSGQDSDNQALLPVAIERVGLAPVWFAAAGIFIGLGLYVYAAARFLPLLFGIFFMFWFWQDKSAWKQQRTNVVVLALVSFFVALPLIVYFLNNPYFIVYRSRYISNRGAGTYPGQPWITWSFNVGRVIRGLFWKGDSNLLRNLPGRAFLDPIQALLFLLGIVAVFSERLTYRKIFLLLWLLIMLLPSILSGDAPHFARLIGAAPPLAILIAFGSLWIFGLFTYGTRQSTSLPGPLVTIVVLALFLVSGSVAVRDYFRRYATYPGLSTSFNLSDWELGQYAANLPEDTLIYLSPTQQQMATIYFALGDQLERLRSFYSPDGLLPLGHVNQPTSYLLREPIKSTLDRLNQVYPSGVLGRDTNGFTAYQVDEGSLPIITPNDLGITWGGAIALNNWIVIQQQHQLGVTLIWEAEVEMERDYTAFVHLLDQDGSLIAQLDRQPEGYPTSDWQPGERVMDTYLVKLPAGLDEGEYLLQTGFYYLPADERLGKPELLGSIALDKTD
jgi:hypothetical protein